ncbi:MAG: hypothetical protein C7B46_20200 [Sulfobacillus benefaciens]|uniref:Ketopantoate reductase N-terminal domain-containing protein n=1 Tax=Sulfobacillus benefaciens TaxID=453960 RepID=A0A2T2WVB6_9FIRM|nr:MAG: hypothetical protein C7B46_20200 [Sulfobacillus benefaciens]
MDSPIVVIGMGQLGTLFADAWIQLGQSTLTIRREQRVNQDIAPRAVLIATGEQDLPPVLASLPHFWRSHVILIQNELVPQIWVPYTDQPTLVAVWAEKKPHIEVHSLRSSVVFGPHTDLVADAFAAMNQPLSVAKDYSDMLLELSIKNIYIWATNIYGLSNPGSLGQLAAEPHAAVLESLMAELCQVHSAVAGYYCAPQRIIPIIWHIIHTNADLKIPGRSARTRLERVMSAVHQHSLATPELSRIAKLNLNQE